MSEMMEGEILRRYNTLLMEFKIQHTLELKSGKCACVKCQKLFRSMEYLRLHFEREHSAELKELENKAKELAEGDLSYRKRRFRSQNRYYYGDKNEFNDHDLEMAEEVAFREGEGDQNPK